MFKRILVVCVGNICRSPTAEYLLRQRLPQGGVEVGSAGLGAMIDYPIESTAAQVLVDHGIDGSEHRARQVTPGLLRESDLILVMEKSHVAAIGRMAPEVSGKVFLLGKWQDDAEISDPFRQERPAFDHVYDLIESSVDAWLPHLQPSVTSSHAR